MMNEDLKLKFIDYLEVRDIKFRDSGVKVQHQCLNPEHIEDNPSAFTSFERLGEEFSHCSSCKVTIHTEQLYKLLNEEVDASYFFNAKLRSFITELSKIPESCEESVKIYTPIKEGDFLKPYRGISPETFKRVGAYYCDSESYYGKRILISIRDVDETVKSFEAISTNKKVQPKILRPKTAQTTKLFGFENLVESNVVFLCEGIFNSLSFMEIGYDSIFNFGVGSIEGKVNKLVRKGVKTVIMCGDNDNVGKSWNTECAKILRKSGFNVSFFNFPYNSPDKFDINNLLIQLGLEKFKYYVDNILNKNLIKVKRK